MVPSIRLALLMLKLQTSLVLFLRKEVLFSMAQTMVTVSQGSNILYYLGRLVITDLSRPRENYFITHSKYW